MRRPAFHTRHSSSERIQSLNPTAAGALRLLSTPVAVAFALLTAATPAWSVGTRSVGDDSYEDFSAGELESVALSSDGFLLPTYARTSIGDTGEAIVWDVLRESGGAYIGATGHRGRLVRVNDNGTTRSLAEVDDPQVTALARLQDGSVLFGRCTVGHALPARRRRTASPPPRRSTPRSVWKC